MKKIKLLLIIFVFFIIITRIIFFVIRSPSYTIQTSGKLYIVNKLSSSITVFDLYKGKKLTEFGIEVEPHEATTLVNPNRVAITNYGAPNIVGKSITVIDTKDNSIQKTIELEESLRPHGIITFPQPHIIGAVTDIGNDLLVVNIEKGIVEKRIPTQQKMSHLLVHHPKKPLVFVSNINSNSVSVIDLDQEKVIKIIPCGLGTEAIDITPDGLEIWVTNNKDNSINIIDTNTYKIINTLNTGDEPLRLKFSIDGKYCLVSNSREGTISVYDRLSKKEIKSISVPGKKNIIERILYHSPRPVGILMHPNGKYAFIANSNADKVEVIDLKTLTIVSTIGTGRVPDGLTLSE